MLSVHSLDPPPEIQVPFTARQPAETSIPWAKVEVAFVSVTSIAPAKVEVAVVVPVKNADTISPTTESFAKGEVVPIRR